MSQHLFSASASKGTLVLGTFVSIAAVALVGSGALLLDQHVTSSTRALTNNSKDSIVDEPLKLDENSTNDDQILDDSMNFQNDSSEDEGTTPPTPSIDSNATSSSVNVSNTNGSVRIETNTNGQKMVKEYTTDESDSSVKVNVQQKVSNGVTIKDSVNVTVNGETVVDKD